MTRRSAPIVRVVAFGWDNEFDGTSFTCRRSRIDALPVTNAQFLEFIDAGGYTEREWWSDEGWAWIQADAFGIRPSGYRPHVGRGPRALDLGAWQWRGMFDAVPLPADVARLRQPGGSVGLRALEGTAADDRSRNCTAPRRASDAPGGRTPDFAGSSIHVAGIRLATPRQRRSVWGVHDLVGNGWEWTSTVFGPFHGFTPMRSYPGVFGRLLRRPALRDEGRVAGDRARADAAELPQLVPRQLSLRLRQVPHGRRHERPDAPLTTGSTRLAADFAADVRRDLALTPKQLQSKYLYDALGSSLFEAICRLPWYRITRAERSCSSAHAPRIVGAAVPRRAGGAAHRRARLRQRREDRDPRRGAAGARRGAAACI